MSNCLLFSLVCILMIMPGHSQSYLKISSATTMANRSNCKQMQKHPDIKSENIVLSGGVNKSMMTFNLMNFDQSVTIEITGKTSVFNVGINASINGDTAYVSIPVAKENESLKPLKNKNIMMIGLKSSGFSSNSNYTKACFDFGIVYNISKKALNSTAVNIGCWDWSHNGTHFLNHTEYKNSDFKSFGEKLIKKECNGSLASIKFTPTLAVLLAVLITIINK